MRISQRVTREFLNRGSTVLTTTLSRFEWVGVHFWFRLDSR
jgi:hypothetical protein